MKKRPCIAALSSLVSAAILGCGSTHHSLAGPVTVPSPLEGIGRGPVFPIGPDVPSTPSASPSPFAQIPFAFPPGPQARVAVYDRPRNDVWYYPGSGPGVENVFTLNPGQYYYDDTQSIFLLDAWREEQIKLVDGLSVGGFAFAPSFDSNYHLYFLGQSVPTLAAQLTGFAYETVDAAASPSIDTTNYATVSSAPSITGPPQPDINPYLPKVRFLDKINALAVQHGEVTSISVDGGNDAVAFTTGDGGLYLYTPQHPQVFALLADEVVEGGFHATACYIDPIWGRWVFWQDTARQGLYVLDRWTGLIDPMPYAKIAVSAVSASAPSLYENDPYEVVFTLTFKDGSTRLALYNILNEQVLNLTVLNDFRNSVPLYLH